MSPKSCCKQSVSQPNTWTIYKYCYYIYVDKEDYQYILLYIPSSTVFFTQRQPVLRLHGVVTGHICVYDSAVDLSAEHSGKEQQTMKQTGHRAPHDLH